MLQKIIMISSLFIFSLTLHASYLINHYPDGSSTYIGSVPYTTNSFEYSNGGNSVGFSERHYVPIIINNATTQGYWVWLNNSNVPSNAIVFEYINGYPTYYCRAQNGNQMEYGRLVPNEGCFLSSDPSVRYNVYQTLVR